MSSLASLLALLQLNDPAFPIGTFAHSYGLEQAVRDGYVRTAADLERFGDSILRHQAAGADTRALYAAAEAAGSGDLDQVCRIDATLFATKAAAELRAASTTTGRRLCQEVALHAEARGLISGFLEAIKAQRTPGTHPVAFGVVGSAFDLEASELAAASLFATANTLWSAAMRLLPVSHRDVQAALHRHRECIAALALEATTRAREPLTAFHPLQEIASMRHTGAPVRFFAS